MNIVLGTLELTTISGVGTYLLTVAEQLERMGHPVTIFTEELGEVAAIAERRGLRVEAALDALPESCDVVYAQDAPSAYRLAEIYRGVPQAFCVHATDHDRWAVPQLEGVTSAAVTFTDRGTRYARSLAVVPELIQLRQPVDLRRFSPRSGIGESARRALWLGNYGSGNLPQLLGEACAEADIELVRRGLRSEFTSTPELEMNDSDIVIGRSRVIVEAMACGRAAYIYDYSGWDGWVTHDRYARLAADNFDGRTEDRPSDVNRLRGDLSGYRREMGADNRDLAVAHHGARSHCEALIELFGRMSPERVPSAPLEELARLTRIEWQADARALGFEHEAQLLRQELQRRNAEQAGLHEASASAERRALEAERRAAAAEAEARQAHAALESLQAQLRPAHLASRALASMARPFSRLRRGSRTG